MGMDAIQILERHLDVEKILEHYSFENAKPSGNYIRACCALHGGSNPMAFVINQENGLWTCHTSCGSGNIFQLVQRLEDISFPESVHRVAEILGINITELKIIARDEQERKELKRWIKAIKAMQIKELEEYQPIGDAKRVTKFKDFKPETIEKFGLFFFDKFYGFNKSNEPFELSERLAFPIISNGKLVGVSLRATKPNQTPKWLHQPSLIKTSELLYNFDNAIGQEEVTVVEGITDVWAYDEIGVVAVCTYGAKITEEQKRMLLQLGCNLNFSFDGDEAGIMANKKAFELFKSTSNISFTLIPFGSDPANLTREELKKLYDERK